MFRPTSTAIIRCVGLTILPLSCAGCLEIWDSQPPGTLSGFAQACTGIALLLFIRKSGTVSLLERSQVLPRPVQGSLYFSLYGRHQLVVQIPKKKCILGKGLRFTSIICDILVY